MDEIAAWLRGRVPDEWFTEPVSVVVDRDEIVVVGRIAEPGAVADATPETIRAGEAGRVGRFREDTRGARMQVADEAEARFGRKVAWGARCGETEQVFTNLSIPVMTRLRQPERRVLDTLIEAGVARSRSEALAWSVRLVARHEGDWISRLREAMVGVEQVRAEGPTA